MPAVFDNRRADCRGKIIGFVLRQISRRGKKERARIKLRTAKTIRECAADFICSRRRNDIHNHSRRVAEFRRKTICQQLNFADVGFGND